MKVPHNLKNRTTLYTIQLHQVYAYTQQNSKQHITKVPAHTILTAVLFTMKEASQLKCPSIDEDKM